MGFDGNYDVWKDFIKTIKKLDRSNVLVPDIQRQKPNIHKVDAVTAVLNSRVSRQYLCVVPMNRAEIKSFKPKKSIDLHGYTREIDGTLATFCAKAILAGIYEAVVITGKGQGIVKSAAKFWLKSHPEFVVSFFEIRDSMGESGAFGIKLRRR